MVPAYVVGLSSIDVNCLSDKALTDIFLSTPRKMLWEDPALHDASRKSSGAGLIGTLPRFIGRF